MRRLFTIVSAGFIALGVAATTTLAATAQTSWQQPTEDASTPRNTTSYDVEAQAAFISQGSAIDTNSPELAAVRADVAEEDRLPDYSQVVDNTTGGRFSGAGWQTRSDAQGISYDQESHGGSYASSGSSGDPARFKVRIPTSNDYTVYAWWPAFSGSSDAARFGIGAASGTQWTTVDQTTDGGDWIKLGTYAMKKGERFIQLPAGSPGSGATVADAVAVVRGDVTMPPADGAVTMASSQEATYSATSVRDPNGRDVVRVAKRWLGVGYKWGTCTRSRMSCTCETKKTYARFGHELTMVERQQWRYDRGTKRIRHRYNLHRGDEVFFKERGLGGPITHVAIFSGNGNVVHASSYWGKVTESKMKYLRGYFGAKRYNLH